MASIGRAVPELQCAVVACGRAATTIYGGFALCESCWRLTDEIPEHIPLRFVLGIIAEMDDEHITGDNSLAAALAKRGFSRVPRSARHDL
jgi:hypothetical protein